MRQRITKLFQVGILIVMVLCFTGCRNVTNNTTSSETIHDMQTEMYNDDGKDASELTDTEDSTEGIGYREEILTPPDGSTKIYAMKEVKGSAWIITERGIYSSDDKGSSWGKMEEQSGWLPENVLNAVSRNFFAAISDSGRLAFYSEEEKLCVFETDGKSTTINIDFENSLAFYGMKFADENTLVMWDTAKNVYVIDISNGNVTGKVSSSEEMHYYCAPVDGRIVTVTAEGAKFYDYTGEQQEGNDVIDGLIRTDFYYWSEKSYGGEIVEDAEKTGIFYASHSGLFHYMWGGSISEQLFEGSYTKLGDSDRILLGMTALSGDAVLCVFDDTKGDDAVNEILVRYDFSGTQKAVQTLTLYTLEENELLSDEINTFNQNSSDFHVMVEVGLSGNSGMTVDDAIKVLNTEILAGSGPDILILDGMNVEAYCESGMLADLSGILAEVANEEGVYENIAYTYQTDSGAVYAVPARFQVPMMVSTQEILDQITDLGSLADTILKLQNANPEMTNLIGCYDTLLLERLMTFCSPAWLTEEGALDETIIREFLETVKVINEIPHESVSLAGFDEIQASYDAKDEEIEAVTNISVWKNGVIGFFRGNSLNTTASVFAVNGDEGLVYESARGQSSNVFVPMQIVGVNANSSNQEQALKFVKQFLLSKCQSELSVDYRGYPVNKAGFWTMAEDVVSAGTKGEVDWQMSDERLEEIFKDTEDVINTLSNRSITDTVITASVKKEGTKYLDGEIDLDTAVGNIMQTVNLHLAE